MRGEKLSSKNRRLYQMGKMSVREFYGHHVRWIAEAVGKESVFEKPYLDEDRGRMHADPSWPDWPSMPPIPPYPPLPPIPGPGPVPGCAISCYPPHMDCDNPVWCHPSIWCGADLGCTLCTWTVEGAVKNYEPHRSGVGSWGIDIWIDEELVEPGGQALITACMTDPCGNVCCEDIEVSCKVCPPEVAMTWDDALSDETIAQGAPVATADVYVQDGVGPYKWSVAGTGFSIPSETSGVHNVLSADNTACGMATITVTDFCDTSKTGRVRCTTGNWCEIAFTSCVITGVVTEGDDQTRIFEQYKLEEDWRIHTSAGGAGVDCSWLAQVCSRGAPDCHDAMGCTKCLTHAGNQYCGTNASYDTPCQGSPNYCCCQDSACDTSCGNYCNKPASKLYEWKCSC